MPVYLPPGDIISGGWGPVPGELALEPVYTRGSVRGGPLMAEIEVRGPLEALEETLDWLRRPVFVRNENGMDVWWGFVNEVRLSAGASTYTRSLDDLANRVAVAYDAPSPDGSSERRTTAWATDANSISRYGTKEYLDSFGAAQDAQATGRRAILLGQMASPVTTPAPSASGEALALLICVGWLETLDWLKYQRLEGRVEFDGGSGDNQPIGWGITASAQLGFGDQAIHDAAGRMGGLAAGMKIIVSSSVSNDRTFTVEDDTSEEVESYTADTIYFQPADDILDAAGGMGMVKADHWLLVSGSAANSRWHRIGQGGADHARTSSAVSGLMVNEAAGPTITLTQAQRLAVLEAAAYEAPGSASVSVVLMGHILAQSFALPAAASVAQVAVKVGKMGSPADAFRLYIYSDSSGQPNALLATGELAAADVDEDTGWRWVTLPLTSLVAGTYWIVVSRVGSVDGANHYTVGLSTDSYGTCLAWANGTWYANPLGQCMPFRVWTGEDTAAQMRRVVSDGGQFLAAADLPAATGIVTNPYRDEGETALETFLKLLDSGTVSGWRLLAQVTPERVLQVTIETGPGDNLPAWGTDGVLRHAGGGPLPRGWLPAGEWITVEGLSPATRAAVRASPVMIEEVEYDWREGVLRPSRWKTTN